MFTQVEFKWKQFRNVEWKIVETIENFNFYVVTYQYMRFYGLHYQRNYLGYYNQGKLFKTYRNACVNGIKLSLHIPSLNI